RGLVHEHQPPDTTKHAQRAHRVLLAARIDLDHAPGGEPNVPVRHAPSIDEHTPLADRARARALDHLVQRLSAGRDETRRRTAHDSELDAPPGSGLRAVLCSELVTGRYLRSTRATIGVNSNVPPMRIGCVTF